MYTPYDRKQIMIAYQPQTRTGPSIVGNGDEDVEEGTVSGHTVWLVIGVFLGFFLLTGFCTWLWLWILT